MSNDRKSLYDDATEDLSPPFNVYTGRDTSVYALSFFEKSLTQQEFADECDVNNIMRRYAVTGTVPVYADRQPFYVDASDMPSFMDMQNILISARESFMSLPAEVRRQFDNDPIAFAEYAADEKNAAKLREWKMLSPEALERLDAADAAAAVEAAKAVQAAAEAAGGAKETKSTPPS